MKRYIGILLATLMIILSSNCRGGAQALLTREAKHEKTAGLVATEMATITPTLTSTPTQATTFTPTATLLPTNTPTVTPTPWDVVLYTPERLRAGVEGIHYINDTCQYLASRWGDNKSTPGTIVVPIMFHSISQPGRTIKDNTTISEETFIYFMEYARQLGYQTITTDQLFSFMKDNARIPERSMILILDDRRPGVTRTFLPYLEANGWTLTLGWISALNSEAQWLEMEEMASSGNLDIQSHGYKHIYIEDYTSEEAIREELFTSMTLLEEHFGKKPKTIVWPGGNFIQKSVDIAIEAGYQLGFTSYSRGPLFFNTIPLGEEERSIDQPFFVLPRFWSTAGIQALDDGVRYSESAKTFANQQRESELLWKDLFCEQ